MRQFRLLSSKRYIGKIDVKAIRLRSSVVSFHSQEAYLQLLAVGIKSSDESDSACGLHCTLKLLLASNSVLKFIDRRLVLFVYKNFISKNLTIATLHN